MSNPKSTITARRVRTQTHASGRIGVPKEEAKLHRLLKLALRREKPPRGQSRLVCSELDVWSGIADVVVATTRRDNRVFSWTDPEALSRLNLTTTKIISMLRVRERSRVADLATRTGLTVRTICLHIEILRELDLVQTRGDWARLTRSVQTPFSDVAAFEVKVSDWRHGLYQATHYRNFANRIALALPDKKAQTISAHKGLFKLYGIGLVGIARNAAINWYIKPVPRKPASPGKCLFGVVQILRQQTRAWRLHETSQLTGSSR